MKKKRPHHTPEEKVAILRRHLVEHATISDLCDEYQLQPRTLYLWQQQFFENGAAAFARNDRPRQSVETVKIQQRPRPDQGRQGRGRTKLTNYNCKLKYQKTALKHP